MNNNVLKDDTSAEPVMQRPFPGLQSFQESNKSQFGGRDHEISELSNLIDKNPLAIVFGKSGIGKTSLLLAGLIPELENKFYLPIYIRLDFLSNKSPLNQLKDFVYEKLKAKDPTVTPFGNRTLWQYFHELRLLNGLFNPVLILDQFEEIFTLGKKHMNEVNELIIELSDLAENRIPLSISTEIQQQNQLGSFNYSDPKYRVVISLREDYLAQLESFQRYLPSMKNARYRVLKMTVLQALDAAIKPGKGLIDHEVATAIIRKITGVEESDFDTTIEKHTGKVEPFLLSLICFQINEKRIERGLDRFTVELVNQFEIADVINSYYEDAVSPFEDDVRKGIEDELLTEGGYRKLETAETLKDKYQINDNIIQTLIDKRILRKEEREGVDYVELIHDVLAKVIQGKRDKRRALESEYSFKRALDYFKYQRKQKLLKWGAFIGILVIAIVFVVAFLKIAENRRIRNLEFAQDFIEFPPTELPADTLTLDATIAYMIYKKNGGTKYSGYYLSIYNNMQDIDSILWKGRFSYLDTNASSPSVSLKAMDMFNGMIYSIYNDTTIRQAPWSIYTNEKDITNDVLDNSHKQRSHCLAIDKKNHHLARFGKDNTEQNSLQLADLNEKPIQFHSIYLPKASKDIKAIKFGNRNELYAITDTNILHWDLNQSNQLMPWKKKKYYTYQHKQYKLLDLPSNQNTNDSLLSISTSNSCFAEHEGTLYVGTGDSRLIIIKQDSIIEMKDSSWGEITCMTVDHKGNFVYFGNQPGSIFKMDLRTYEVELNETQHYFITSLSLNSRDSILVSGNARGYVCIYNTDKWKSSKPLSLIRKSLSHYSCCSLAISEDNLFALAAYSDGEIYKWPITIDWMMNEIYTKLKIKPETLDTIIHQFIGKKLPDESPSKYNYLNKKLK